MFVHLVFINSICVIYSLIFYSFDTYKYWFTFYSFILLSIWYVLFGVEMKYMYACTEYETDVRFDAFLYSGIVGPAEAAPYIFRMFYCDWFLWSVCELVVDVKNLVFKHILKYSIIRPSILVIVDTVAATEFS